MAAQRDGERSYFDVKAAMGSGDAMILERLVERQDSPLAVVRDLQSAQSISQAEAFGRVRSVLWSSICSLRAAPVR